MTIIEIKALDNGAHRNQSIDSIIPVPDGWAVIPDGLPIPDAFPFVGVESKDGIVIALVPGQAPPAESDSVDPQTDLDLMAAAYQEGVQGA